MISMRVPTEVLFSVLISVGISSFVGSFLLSVSVCYPYTLFPTPYMNVIARVVRASSLPHGDPSRHIPRDRYSEAPSEGVSIIEYYSFFIVAY